VRFPSFPIYASAEMSLSSRLLLLDLWRNMIQVKDKGGEFNQLPQFRECRDVRKLRIVRARNGVGCDTDRVKGW
jgi:hypothetical protein